jgi:pre-mRNA-splicing helicase BRR2
MEMSQMVVQAMWDRDSPLLQIPHFTPETVRVLKEYDVKDVYEFMDKMDPNENPDYGTLIKRLGLDSKQLVDAANFTNNKYPNVELDFKVQDERTITAGAPAYLQVKIERQLDDEDEDEKKEPDTTVHAPFYPGRKMENWWLVVAEEATKSLLAIKRVTVGRVLETKLEYVVPTPGKHDLTLYLMCDSYFGVDQDPTFSIEAAEGMEEDEEEDEE